MLKNGGAIGIVVEFNPDLALRDIGEHKQGRRQKEECIPEKLKVGEIYNFLKSGQRNYWLDGEVPLLITKGNQKLSRPIASILILEAVHFKQDSQTWTRGRYKVLEVFKDEKVYFESYARVGERDDA